MKSYGIIIIGGLFLSFSSNGVYAHPGRTDSSGGHHNRKTGGYHTHSSTPTRVTTPRQTPLVRTQARTSARTSSKLDYRGQSRTISSKSKEEKFKFVSKKTSGKTLIVKIQITSVPTPTETELKQIAESLMAAKNYNVFFYLNNMDVESKPWAICLIRYYRKTELRMMNED
ncbi:YHYH domain-containing protein [Planctomicrobium sp.]|jgi:hypothetical protein|nr:YHYH domain-containing protein [Planctomicrobium sp.]MDB4744021.1 YHYH domain-containing protein [Planctomicrobium sp.]